MSFVFDCDHRHQLTFAEIKRLVGGKAANLAVMAVDLGLPVPPAFTISTTACNAYLAGGWPDGLDAELREHMARMEERVGHRFGDSVDPLVVSVRSGAPVSMPGMMDTILNLGLNDATTAGLGDASASPKFAANCRARFETMFRDIVGVDLVPEDPWEQLRAAVQAVFRSWNSDRARSYRQREGIPDDLGTAVTVQAMVFGNRSVDSGTGVLFTRNPATGEHALYGDVMFNAQGEDVVAGTHPTQKIADLDERMPEVARELRDYAMRLERHHADLCDIEFTIEHGRLWLLQCRVGKRTPQAALRIAIDMADDPDFPLTRAEAVRRVAGVLAHPPETTTDRADAGPALTSGLPASPGVACGEIAVTPDAAVAGAEAGRDVILVRAETSPDDVHGMARAAGILTASGGLASHAAVVARGWGIPAVVGAAAVQVQPDGVVIEGRRFAVGDVITIDGATGEVFAGSAGGTSEVVPEAATLLGWASELGITIGEEASPAAATTPANPSASTPGALATAAVPPTPATAMAPGATAPADAPATTAPADAPATTAPATDDLLRVLVVKGYATPEGVATALLCTPDRAAALLDRLVADGLVEKAAGSFRLTADGKSVGRKRIEADTERWGADNAVAALDAFLALDLRMKDTVTAWQMREIDGAQAFNDHSDAVYDAKVLDDLAALHGDASAWLRPLAAGLPRLAAYLERLERAAAAARSGDGRFVASPRVDSYHGAWFELHEDLILLAGRKRADEVAAGRA